MVGVTPAIDCFVYICEQRKCRLVKKVGVKWKKFLWFFLYYWKMERDNFDPELFIDEVEKRPAIWDMESSEYSNRNLKKYIY